MCYKTLTPSLREKKSLQELINGKFGINARLCNYSGGWLFLHIHGLKVFAPEEIHTARYGIQSVFI
jgi:hypothetical protein